MSSVGPRRNAGPSRGYPFLSTSLLLHIHSEPFNDIYFPAYRATTVTRSAIVMGQWSEVFRLGAQAVALVSLFLSQTVAYVGVAVPARGNVVASSSSSPARSPPT